MDFFKELERETLVNQAIGNGFEVVYWVKCPVYEKYMDTRYCKTCKQDCNQK